jgi:phosphonoacetaldehyde hydrolase
VSLVAPEIRLVVFDWAGTTVDHGSLAPVAAFVEAFARHGVTVTADQARGPMGLHKRDHIRAMLQERTVSERWQQAHQREWTEADLESLYQAFMPLQMEVLDRHSTLIPGVLDGVAELRHRKIRIGATTGYFRAAAERIYRSAREQGLVPDACLCAEDVLAGRPAPWMIFRLMEQLDVFPPAAVVKVGDTVHDIGEGLSAGAWSVGVTRAGSEVGLSAEDYAALSESERQARVERARTKLLAAGAHAAIESVAELPALLDSLAERVRRGERP